MFKSIIEWFKLLWFNPKSIDELMTKMDNPKSMATWIGQHITYMSDQVKHNLSDYWQSAEETFKDRTGDCEDFAVLAYHILCRLGFNPYILGVWGRKSMDEIAQGHAICVFIWDGNWYHFSNWGLFKVKANNVEEVAFQVYPIFNYGREFTEEGKSLRFFTKSVGRHET